MRTPGEPAGAQKHPGRLAELVATWGSCVPCACTQCMLHPFMHAAAALAWDVQHEARKARRWHGAAAAREVQHPAQPFHVLGMRLDQKAPFVTSAHINHP